MKDNIPLIVRTIETESDAHVIGVDVECRQCKQYDHRFDEKQPAFSVTPITLIVPVVCQNCGYTTRIELYL